MGGSSSYGECALCKVHKPVWHSAELHVEVCSNCYKRHLQPPERCSRCGQVRRVGIRPTPDRPVCERCYRNELRRGPCAECHATRPLLLRVEHQLVCQSCYRRLRAPREACAGCGVVSLIARRLTDGSPYCSACYQRTLKPRDHCVVCRRRRPVAARTDEGPICPTCHRRSQVEACGLCGEVARVQGRLVGGKPVCPACWEQRLREREPCSSCGQIRPAHRRTEIGAPLCGGCSQRAWRRSQPIMRCTVCHEKKSLGGRDAQGKRVCRACYRRTVNASTCAICRETRPLENRTASGQHVCARCHRQLGAEPCGFCGRTQPVKLRTNEHGPVCGACYKRELWSKGVRPTRSAPEP